MQIKYKVNNQMDKMNDNLNLQINNLKINKII